MGEYITKQIGMPNIITWIITAMAAITFFLVQDAMSDMTRLVEKIDGRVDLHLENHPDHALRQDIATNELRIIALEAK